LVRTLAEANEILAAQRAALSGDDHVRREVAQWLDSTPGERLVALAALCRDSIVWLSRLAPDQRVRALAPDPLPDDAVAILGAMRRR
jgi:hypothetical protein